MKMLLFGLVVVIAVAGTAEVAAAAADHTYVVIDGPENVQWDNNAPGTTVTVEPGVVRVGTLKIADLVLTTRDGGPLTVGTHPVAAGAGAPAD